MSDWDLFNEVEKQENYSISLGKVDGEAKAKTNSFHEGSILGYQEGCHLLEELGVIEGLLESIALNTEDIDEKLQKSIDKLLDFVRCHKNWNKLEIARQNLLILHGKSKFILKKFKIDHKIIQQEVDNEF